MLHAGAVLLTASDGPSVNGLFLMFVIVQAIYGVGVGGEYPVVCLAIFSTCMLFVVNFTVLQQCSLPEKWDSHRDQQCFLLASWLAWQPSNAKLHILHNEHILKDQERAYSLGRAHALRSGGLAAWEASDEP